MWLQEYYYCCKWYSIMIVLRGPTRQPLYESETPNMWALQLLLNKGLYK